MKKRKKGRTENKIKDKTTFLFHERKLLYIWLYMYIVIINANAMYELCIIFSASVNKWTWVVHIRFCFTLLWLPPSVILLDQWPLYTHTHIHMHIRITAFYFLFYHHLCLSLYLSFVLIGVFCIVNLE